MKKQLEIPMQTRLAGLGTIDAEKRTVDLVFSTGAAVRRFDWWKGEEIVEELSMDPAHIRMERLNAGAPLLDTHGRYQLAGIIGVVQEATISDGEGRATVRFSRRTEVDPIWQDLQDGIIRNVSVGYIVHKLEDVSEKGEKPRRMRAMDWEPVEISLVPVGADAKAGVRAEEATHTCTFEIRESENTEDQATAGQSAPPAERGGVGLDLLRRRLELVSIL